MKTSYFEFDGGQPRKRMIYFSFHGKVIPMENSIDREKKLLNTPITNIMCTFLDSEESIAAVENRV
jgi:hypothetical protein